MPHEQHNRKGRWELDGGWELLDHLRVLPPSDGLWPLCPTVLSSMGTWAACGSDPSTECECHAEGSRTVCLESIAQAVPRGGFSDFARHQRLGGEAGASWAMKPRNCLPQTGSTASKPFFLRPGASCLSRMLLYRSACSTEGINHIGLGKKDHSHKYPTKCLGSFLLDLTCLLINCRIFLPSAKARFMPVTEAGLCCL